MQEKILNQIDSDKLKVFVVWMPVLPGDSHEQALASMELISDGRTVHYWDSERKLGGRYGTVVDLPRGWQLAWDVYFAFDAQTEWKETPPLPADWMHQLADDERRLDGEKLRQSIEKLLRYE